MKCTVTDEPAMARFAADLARALRPQLDTRAVVVSLQGDLGTGKTTLVRGMLRALGHTGRVPSPTYTLVEPYRLADGTWVQHLDLYRLSDPEELEFLGFREWTATPGLLLVEWPENAPVLLERADLRVMIGHAGEGRVLRLEGRGQVGGQVLDRLSVCRQEEPQ